MLLRIASCPSWFTSRVEVRTPHRNNLGRANCLLGYIKNASPNRNGTGLVTASDNNIIFISFNYRVGLFGFLASEEVKSDGDLNVGLLDQRFLFQWLKDNIAQVCALSYLIYHDKR